MSAMKQENDEEDDKINKESVTGEEESEEMTHRLNKLIKRPDINKKTK